LTRCIPIKHPRSSRIAGGILEIPLPSDLRGPQWTRLRLRIRGVRRWQGKEGRLELVWDPARRTWYAGQSVEVERRVPQRRPREFAAIDRGARAPVALAVEGSEEAWVFPKQGAVEGLPEPVQAHPQAPGPARHEGAALLQKSPEAVRQKTGRLLAVYRALARTVVRILRMAGVTDLLVGDITGIHEDMDFGRLNEVVHNFRSFRELLGTILDACERARIRVRPKPEHGTSSHCALCGNPVARPTRSRVRCPAGHEFHADVSGALNLPYREPEVRARAGGRPRWRTCRWTGHRWVPTESARGSSNPPGTPHAAVAA
jgi:putative transposase